MSRDMKCLAVPFLSNVHCKSSWEAIEAALDEVPETVIEETPWVDYSYAPYVTLRIGHTPDSIVLRFSIDEEVAQANYRNTQDPVHKDSCVEFFVSFDGGGSYYNMEFNCLGTRMMAYGKSVLSERTKLPVGLVESIRTHTSLDLERPLAEQGRWELLVSIPFRVFIHQENLGLTGKTISGNFYKCGDDLPTPHYVAWNHVDYPMPNFHQPDSFGRLTFLAP